MRTMNSYDIPVTTKASIDNWVTKGWLPGSFVEAVLCSDLFAAYMAADHNNLAAMKDIVRYVYNECPSACYGSVENVEGWRNRFFQERDTPMVVRGTTATGQTVYGL